MRSTSIAPRSGSSQATAGSALQHRFRERFAKLLTHFSLHLGAEGERAAEALAEELLAGKRLRTSRLMVAYVLASHAQARGERLASRWDALLVPANNPSIEAKLREMLGPARFPR